MAARIEVSGEIGTQEILGGLIEAAIADQVTNYTSEDEHGWIEAEIRAAADAGRAIALDGEGTTIFENLTSFCEDHGLSYRRTSDADDQFSAEIVTFDAATGAKDEYEQGHRDRVVVGVDTLASLKDMAGLAALVESMRAGERESAPIVLALAPSPATA